MVYLLPWRNLLFWIIIVLSYRILIIVITKNDFIALAQSPVEL